MGLYPISAESPLLFPNRWFSSGPQDKHQRDRVGPSRGRGRQDAQCATWGSARKMDTEEARWKARVMKAEDILDILPIPTAIHVRGHGFRSLNIKREN
jgi:hypothetical protein